MLWSWASWDLIPSSAFHLYDLWQFWPCGESTFPPVNWRCAPHRAARESEGVSTRVSSVCLPQNEFLSTSCQYHSQDQITARPTQHNTTPHKHTQARTHSHTHIHTAYLANLESGLEETWLFFPTNLCAPGYFNSLTWVYSAGKQT